MSDKIEFAVSFAEKPDYIVFDNKKEFEFYKKWGWSEGSETLVYDPDFPKRERGDFTISIPIDHLDKDDEEDMEILEDFKNDVKTFGWCNEAIEECINEGFIDITPTAIFERIR